MVSVKKSVIIAICIIIVTSAFSQTFNWTGYPTNGATWNPSANFNMTKATGGSGSFDVRESGSGGVSPLGFGTAGSDAQNCGTYTGLRLEMSGAGNSGGTGIWNNNITVTVNFPNYLCAPVTFNIYDITEAIYDDGSKNWVYYQDKVSISALDNANNPVTPSATINGVIDNTTSGNTRVLTANVLNGQCKNQAISVGVAGQQIKQITIVYSNQDIPTHCPTPNTSPYRYGISQYQYIFISPIVGAPLPTAAITSPTLACGVTSSILTATTNASSPTYSWTGPGGSIVTSPTASATAVSGAGVYTVVINPGGCSSTATFNIASGGTPPTVTATASNTLNCTTTTVQATASTTTTPASYNWTGPGILSGSTSSVAVVNAGGTYNYTVTNTLTGCKTTGTLAVTQNTSVVTATASASNSISCLTSTAQAIVSTTVSPVSYNWTGPGILSGNTSSVAVVNAGGTYNYTVTNTSNNCKTTGTLSVTSNTVTPPVTTTTGTVSCTTSTTSISATSTVSPVSYTWTGSGITSASNISTITVNQSGTYNYTVTNTTTGCKTTGAVSVATNTTPPSATASNGTITCTSTTATLTGGPSSGVTYSWTGTGLTGSTTSSVATATASGTYTLTTTSVNGCTNTAVATVTTNTTPPQISVGSDLTINCITPTVTLTGNSTTPGVTYSWSPAGSTPTSSTNVVNTPGTYTLTITNPANGCKSSLMESVTSNTTLPNITVGSNQTITCTNTTATLTGSSSSSNTTYSWTPAGTAPTSSINPVTAPGNYSFVVTNTLSGCKSTSVIAVSANTVAPSATATGGTLTCVNTSTTLTGGPASGVTYSWAGPGLTGSTTSSTATATSTGNYTLTTTAANGCTNTAVATVTNNLTTPVANAGSTQTLVCGVSSVTLSGSASPASGTTANWLGGVCGSSSSFTTTACAPGTYTLSVTYTASGCVNTSTVAVSSSTDVPQATVDAVTNSITCTNTVVAIGVTLSNTDPVTYTWSGPGISGTTNTAATTATLAGTYSVTITNTVSNCQSTFNVAVPTNTTPVTANAIASGSITCSTTTANISATPTGTNYGYAWSGPGTITNGTTNSPDVNAGGDYTVTITDNINGCTGTANVNVPTNTVVPTLTLSPSSLTTTCANPTATLSATSSADPDATYSWTVPSTGSLNDPNISNPVANGSGVFTVQVTNTVSGCVSATETVSITADANIPTLTITATNTTICEGGSSTLTISGADTYTWSTTETTNTITVSPTSPTTYSVTGTNTLTGCSNISNITINVNPTPTVGLSANTNAVCEGNSAIITMTGATNYTLTSPQQTTTNTAVVTPTAQTTYTVTGEALGCISTPTTITIDVNQLPQLTVPNQTTCAGSPVTLSATGADTYTWSTTANTSSTTVSPTGNTTYTVAGTNTLTGCTSTVTSVDVTVNALPTVTATANPNTTCTTGTVTLNANTTATSYTWTTGNGVDNTNQNQSTINFPASGLTTGTYTYTVTVTSPEGCVSTPATATLNVIDVPNANFDLSDLSVCQNSSGSISINTPQTGVTYDWNINGQTITNTNPLIIPGTVTNAAGTYTITSTASIGTCSNTAAGNLTVTALPSIALVNPTASACENTSAQLDVANPNPNYTYAWTQNTTVVSTGPGLTVNPLTQANAGTYTATVIDQNGCVNSTTGTIIAETCDIFIPEIFTPNGDGKNDGFVIKNIENYPNNTLKIFNRWGNMVYQKKAYQNEFDGYSNTGDAAGKAKLPAGTYYVILEFGDGKTETYSGYVLLQY